jgi:hypothetical protein
VFGELDAETLLRVGNLPESGHRNRKLTTTKSADSGGGDCAYPLDDPKIALLHSQTRILSGLANLCF